MATQLTPLEPRFTLPPGSDEITDGVYIIGWRLVRDPKDPDSKLELDKLLNLNLTPAVEVASYPEIIPESEGTKVPVLVKPIITGVQPDGQYVGIAKANDNVYPMTLLITLKKSGPSDERSILMEVST